MSTRDDPSPETQRLIQIEIGKALARRLNGREYDCENEIQREGFRAQAQASAEYWEEFRNHFDPDHG